MDKMTQKLLAKLMDDYGSAMHLLGQADAFLQMNRKAPGQFFRNSLGDVIEVKLKAERDRDRIIREFVDVVRGEVICSRD